MLGKQLIPYMKRCLEAFFPSQVLTSLYGSSSHAADIRLDVNSLLVFLEPVMPQDSTQEEDNRPRHNDEAKTKEENDQRKDQENMESNEEGLPEEQPEEKVNEKLPDSEQQKLGLN